MTLLVALEGLDAVGKTRHVDALAAALNAAELDAIEWKHPKPPYHDLAPGTPWVQACWYAYQRAIFAQGYPILGDAYDVLVIDRWLWSTHVAARAVARDAAHHPLLTAMLHLVAGECDALPPVHTILLTAPVDVIAARLRARPEEVPDNLARAQGHYVALAVAHGWPVVNTDRDAAEVTRDLVAIVRRLLTAQGVCPTTEGL